MESEQMSVSLDPEKHLCYCSQGPYKAIRPAWLPELTTAGTLLAHSTILSS